MNYLFYLTYLNHSLGSMMGIWEDFGNTSLVLGGEYTNLQAKLVDDYLMMSFTILYNRVACC